MASAISVVGAIVGIAGAFKERSSMKKAEKAEKRRAEGVRRQTQVEAERARRQAFRERMIAQGQTVGAAANAGFGMSGTSGFQGAVSSIGSQFATNVSNINREEGSAISLAKAQESVISNTNKANQWNKVSSLGFSTMANSESIANGFTSIFKTGK